LLLSRSQLRRAGATGDGRFYYSGFAQAVLFDRLAPDWKERLFDEGVWLEDLLSEALDEVPAAKSTFFGRFVWQEDGDYGYAMLRPAGWLAKENNSRVVQSMRAIPIQPGMLNPQLPD